MSTILAACATAPPGGAGRAVVQADAPFNASGRLSARHGSQAAAANFRWMHAPDRDELTLATPLGSTVAQLDGNPGEVTLSLPDGRTERAPDWETLTAKVLGAPIPVRGLAWWVRASPHADSGHAVERDASGRIAVLRQDGWEIVYGYGESERVRSLRLTYPDTEIRLVIDAFEAP